MKKQVTIKDIAEKLGCSVSTVSRALKDHPDISIKTREAVKELAKLLGYKPNRIALNLKNQQNIHHWVIGSRDTTLFLFHHHQRYRRGGLRKQL